MKNRSLLSEEIRSIRNQLRLRLVELMREGSFVTALVLSEELLQLRLIDCEDFQFVRDTIKLGQDSTGSTVRN